MKRVTLYKLCRSGAMAVEAALVLPFLLVLVLGTVDASYLMLQNHRMETQLTVAGSYLAKSRQPKLYETQAKHLASTGQTIEGGTPIIPDWSYTDITISYKSVNNDELENGETTYRGGDAIKIIQVSSEMPYRGFGFLKAVMGNKVRLSANYEERLIGTTS